MLPAIAQRTHCQNGCLIADKWNCSSPPLRRMIRGDGRTMIGKVASTFHPAPSSLPFFDCSQRPGNLPDSLQTPPRQCRSILVIGSSPVVPAPPALFPGPLSPRSLVPAENNEFRHPLQSHAGTR